MVFQMKYAAIMAKRPAKVHSFFAYCFSKKRFYCIRLGTFSAKKEKNMID